jgi:hypothetical protein
VEHTLRDIAERLSLAKTNMIHPVKVYCEEDNSVASFVPGSQFDCDS